MAQAISINTELAKKILSAVEEIKSEVVKLRKELRNTTLAYGSDAWWEQEILSGEEQIKKGEFKSYKKASQLIADLHQGK